MAAMTLLDGPMGTVLGERGVPLPPPLWSAWALAHDPDAVAAVHRDYAAAGAAVHTTNTFRTQARTVGADWQTLTRRAVQLARAAAAPGQRVAGSIAPLADCYRPDLSPADPGPEHGQMARCLAGAGVDLLLCETFPHVGEGLAAVDQAVATGLPTWASFTAGPDGDLLSPEQLADAALQAIAHGATAVLVNCVPASTTHRWLAPLAALGVPFGAYANAGHPDEQLGWHADPTVSARRYADLAQAWVDLGATILGSCCGTGPAHTAELARRFG